MMRRLLYILITISLATFATAQAPMIEWQQNLGGTVDDVPRAMVKTSDGGFIVVGYTGSFGEYININYGSNDWWILKFSASGQVEWSKSLGGSRLDRATAVMECSDGGFVVAGYSSSSDAEVGFNNGSNDWWIVKLARSGRVLWKKTLGSTKVDWALGITETSDSSYVVIGMVSAADADVSQNYGGHDFWVVKLLPDGALDWERSFGGSNTDEARAVAATANGGVVVVGYTRSTDGNISQHLGGVDSWVIKLSKKGELEWERNLGGSDTDAAYSVVVNEDQSIVVAGNSSSSDLNVSENKGESDIWVVKLRANGELVWEKSMGSTGKEYGTGITKAAGGGYLVIGSTETANGDVSSNHGGFDIWLLHLSEAGALLWEETYGGSDDDYGNAVAQADDGGIFLTGKADSSDGDLTSNKGFADLWVVRLGAGSTATAGLKIPSSSVELYPNPAAATTNFKYITSSSGTIAIALLNTLGQRLRTFTCFKNQLTSLDLDDLPQGHYLLEIRDEQQASVQHQQLIITGGER